jgi:HEXXH motif-containing protein
VELVQTALMPSLPPAFLTLPLPGQSSLPGLVRKLRLIAVRRLATADGRALPPAQRRAFSDLQRLLPRILKTSPAAVLAAVGAPDVLPQLLCLGVGIRPTEQLLAEAVPHMLAALRTAPEAVIWPGPVHRICDPARGIARTYDPPAALLVLDPTGLRVEDGAGAREDWGDGPSGGAFLALGHTAGDLGLVDTNPLSMLEEHPDKDGNALDLGGRSAEEWQGALGEALAVIQAAVPAWAEDLPLVLRRAVPVGWYPEMHLSASYREAPGLIYMSLHPSTLTLAEAIVHECQHGKLNVLFWMDEVLLNGRTTWTPSPVRPDLRPLIGVLLAVHAFVPVAAMHRELSRLEHPLAAGPEFARRRAQVLASNLRGLEILEELSEPTAIGARLLADLRRLHDACALDAPDVPGVDADALPDG